MFAFFSTNISELMNFELSSILYCTLLIAECIGPPTVGTSLLYCMNGFNQQCRAHASIALFDRMYVDFRSANSVVQQKYGLSMQVSHPYNHVAYTSQ